MENKISILFLAPHLSTGGMPAFLLKRVELLQKYTDANVYVVEFKNYSSEYVVQKNKINNLTQVITLGTDKMMLIDIIKNLKIDIVHIDEMIEGFDDHNKVPEELMKALYAPDRTWRIVETCHNVWFNPTTSKRFHPDAYALCTPYHLYTFDSMPSMKEVLEFPISDLRETYNWKDACMELGFDGAKEHVVNIGLWTPGKNQHEAIELARKMPDVQFHFVGNQAVNFKDYWEPLMKDLPSNCKVWGERDDTYKFLLAADVFMFNSTWECNPLVIREAISYGCKILARDLPQYRGMFDDYITAINPAYLKEQLEQLLKGYVGYEIPNDQDAKFVIGHIELYDKIMRMKPQPNELTINMHFVKQPFLEILGESNEIFKVRWFDSHYTQDNLVYETEIKSNSWTKLNREYYSDWAVEVLDGNNNLVYADRYEDKGKRVYIAFDSSSLGDTLAWIPYCEEYRTKHNCKLIVSTFWNELFTSSYPDIEFVKPGSTVENLYAMYSLGWFYDSNKEPELPNTIPLQKAACNILGLEYKEIRPLVSHRESRVKYDNYVAIAPVSTAGCKLWSDENWQKVIDYLLWNGYNVVNVSKEGNMFKDVITPDNLSIENTIDLISNSQFFIGLSSGLSWLAWALRKEVVMISNFTEAEHEFSCHRIVNTGVCHGCWNNPNFKFDKGDWDWCPINKGTKKQFECQKSILPEHVINVIKELQ